MRSLTGATKACRLSRRIASLRRWSGRRGVIQASQALSASSSLGPRWVQREGHNRIPILAILASALLSRGPLSRPPRAPLPILTQPLSRQFLHESRDTTEQAPIIHLTEAQAPLTLRRRRPLSRVCQAPSPQCTTTRPHPSEPAYLCIFSAPREAMNRVNRPAPPYHHHDTWLERPLSIALVFKG